MEKTGGIDPPQSSEVQYSDINCTCSGNPYIAIGNSEYARGTTHAWQEAIPNVPIRRKSNLDRAAIVSGSSPQKDKTVPAYVRALCLLLAVLLIALLFEVTNVSLEHVIQTLGNANYVLVLGMAVLLIIARKINWQRSNMLERKTIGRLGKTKRQTSKLLEPSRFRSNLTSPTAGNSARRSGRSGPVESPTSPRDLPLSAGSR